jgi:hypothetical protein
MIPEVAGMLLAESPENGLPFQGATGISDKTAKAYFPHLLKISEKYGIPVESLVDTWENLVEGIRVADASQGLDSGALNRFIRASISLHAMLGNMSDGN